MTRAGLTHFMKDAIAEAGLPAKCVPHGLRKAGMRRMAEAGKNLRNRSPQYRAISLCARSSDTPRRRISVSWRAMPWGTKSDGRLPNWRPRLTNLARKPLIKNVLFR